MDKSDIKAYLPLVSRPSRYIGGEVNSIKKDPSKVKLSFALCFPDVYDVGMSHLGIRILYDILNSKDAFACERAFSPWLDMEALLRKMNMPLTTLESGRPLKEFDIVGFSLQYELSYTNVLNMLELGGIPLYSKDRTDTDPFVIGGGPSVFNPEPVAEFFDCFLLGDGEEAVLEIADIVMEGRNKHLPRENIIENLSKVQGVYVPCFFHIEYNPDGTVKEISSKIKGHEKIKKRIVLDLNKVPFPVKQVVPFTEIIHDRVSVEIARGCTRGCRFCQAGMTSRPLRERDPGEVIKIVEEAIKNTGYDEVSLLSLSTGDYCSIEELLPALMSTLDKKRVSVSLPSLRVGTLSETLASEIKKVRKTGFTLAPEAATVRLRNVINKNISEKDLIACMRSVFSLGWRGVKLYFMVGLPTEIKEDVSEIVELAKKVRNEGKRAGCGNPDVNISAAAFIPKPHTPFQWFAQIGIEQGEERLKFLKTELKKNRITLKWHSPQMSFFEGVFSRGDRRLAKVIMRAYELGCRYDGWTEEFKPELWKKAFEDIGLDMAFYTRARSKDEIFPWEHLNCGVRKDYLLREYESALKEAFTPDCRTDRCTDCGVCDHKKIKNITFKEKFVGQESYKEPVFDKKPVRARFSFSKTGWVKYLSHLELARAIQRALRRADADVRYSEGFHPMLKVAFSPPLSVGIESMEEYMDVELKDSYAIEELLPRINSMLPDGIRLTGASFISLQLPALSVIIKAQKYSACLNKNSHFLNIDKERIDGHIKEFSEVASFEAELEREGRRKMVDIKPLITDIARIGDCLEFTLLRTTGPSVKPHEALMHLLKLPKEDSLLIPILKVKTIV